MRSPGCKWSYGKGASQNYKFLFIYVKGHKKPVKFTVQIQNTLQGRFQFLKYEMINRFGIKIVQPDYFQHNAKFLPKIYSDSGR